MFGIMINGIRYMPSFKAGILTKAGGMDSYSFEISFSNTTGFININIGQKLFHLELYWTDELLAPLFG